jgi:hypothetical protein
MNTTATNRRLRLLLTAIRDRTLIPRPDFQRRLVWTNKHKLAFLDTVLNNYPFPEIYLAAGDVDPNTGVGTELLVDGQQRVTTLYQYFMGSDEIHISGEIRPYSALTDAEKVAFLEYQVVVRDLGKMAIDQIKEVFRRINSTNYALNAMEISNARFEGELKSFAERLAETSFFERHPIFSATDLRRMQDVRFLLTIVITMMSSYFNRDESLEEYLRNYNDEFEEAHVIEQRMVHALDFIDQCDFPAGSRVWKKSDLFTLIIEIDRMQRIYSRVILGDVAKKNIAGFYETIERLDEIREPDPLLAQYHKASLQATNDRLNRLRRGEVVQLILSWPKVIDWKSWAVHISAFVVETLEAWFFENYKDPADGVPYDNREGGYQYVNGGPYEAGEELVQAFPNVPDHLVTMAADQIEFKGHEWVKRHEY